MNILLVVVDTLRAQQLSCYGYHRPTSPAIDGLAREGVLFEDMVCSGIPTHPSFVTLYTGQHPMTHGIVAHEGEAELARRAPCLPQILLKHGWTTCAVDNLASARAWFHRGFEFYIDPSRRRSLGLIVSCEEQNARAIAFLQDHRDERFFLLVHYWDPHTPYLPPERYRQMFYEGDIGRATDPRNRSLDPLWRHPLGKVWKDTWFKALGGDITDADYVRALYDGSIRYADDGIAALLSALDDIGHADDTLVVLMGDHGECLGEHAVWYDHHGLYEENIHVPFILRLPGRLPAGRRIATTVQTTDIAPTLLALAGVPSPDNMDGRSLTPLCDGSNAGGAAGRDRVVTSECTWQAKWSLRTPDYKFILARSVDFYGSPPMELYDRRADPGETRNLAEEKPEIALALAEELEGWIAGEVTRLGHTDDPVAEQGREKFARKWRGGA
jgi:arylsulfatase A-like enzyme